MSDKWSGDAASAFVSDFIEEKRREIVEQIRSRNMPEWWHEVEFRNLVCDIFYECRMFPGSEGSVHRYKADRERLGL